MKKIKQIAKIIAVMVIIATLAIPFSVFGAQMKQGSDFWYSIGNVKGETFTVDGHTAYCVNPLLPIPNSGNYTAKQINNVSLLKVLYYGYGGIGFNNTTKAKMDSYHNNKNITASGKDLYYGLTRRCAARAYGSNYKFDYYPDWNTAIDAMYTYFQSKNTPVGCKLYIINQNSSSQAIAYLVEDEKIMLQIHKYSTNTSITNNNSCYSLAGAVYGVYTDAACTKKLGEITTNVNGYANYGSPVYVGKYYAKELVAPKGFALSNTVLEFKNVNNISQSSGLNIYMAYPAEKPKNDPVNIVVKKESNSGKALADAEFTIKYYDTLGDISGKTPKAYWIVKTDADGYAGLSSEYLVEGSTFYQTGSGNPCIPLGTVTIQETKAPVGYEIDDELHIFNITDEGYASATEFVQTFNIPTLKNDSFEVSLDKKDEGGKLLAGAEVQLLDSEKNVVAEWTTTTEPYVVSELTVGMTYTYHEVKAPDGYKLADDVIFTFDGTQDLFVSMTDFKTETHIKKTDITGSTEIEGATLTVTEADNLSTVIDEWVSEKEPHVIKGLAYGKEYVLTEKIPAAGYVTANSITFSINDDGSVTEVAMKDDVTKVEVVKVNGKDQLLAGVELQILDKDTDEVVVPTWTTDGNAHRVDGKLIVGKTYLLHEVKSLPNYKPADDVEFTVEDTANVQPVKMINVLSTGSATLHKRDNQNGSLAGTQWQLFTTDDKTLSVTKTEDGVYHFSENGQLQTMDTDQAGKLYIGNLPFGDYYFVEAKAAEGTMPYAKKVPFTVSENTLNPEVTVKDYKTVMYNTGSIGVMPFYYAGAAGIVAIVIGTGIFLFFKKKSTIKKNRSEQ